MKKQKAELPILVPPAPPDYLSEQSKALWQKLLPSETGRRALFIVALQTLDRAEAARTLLAAEGMIATASTGMIRSHPAVRIEADARRLFARIWKQLGFDVAERSSWMTDDWR
jgi:P27 family predicted phage terminase small subunit